jgi:hypothetical protein
MQKVIQKRKKWTTLKQIYSQQSTPLKPVVAKAR